MDWQIYQDMQEIAHDTWQKQIAGQRCCTSQKFISALQAINPEQKFLFFVGFKKKQVVACLLLHIHRFDLASAAPKYISSALKFLRKLFPNFCRPQLAMTGTMESYGRHYWYHPDHFTLETFLREIGKQIAKFQYNVLIFRDYIIDEAIDQEFSSIKNDFRMAGFHMIEALPVAKLSIENFSTAEDYMMSLKSRDRYTIRKAIKLQQKNQLSIEFIKDYQNIIDECYPLFLAVNENATELKTEPLPKEFLMEIKKQFGEDAYFIVVREKRTTIAFALIIETKENMEIFLIGMDYERNRQNSLMYNVLWECIARAVDNNRKQVELGVTNYFIKERFGAKIFPVKIFVKSNNPIIHYLLKKFLDKP